MLINYVWAQSNTHEVLKQILQLPQIYLSDFFCQPAHLNKDLLRSNEVYIKTDSDWKARDVIPFQHMWVGLSIVADFYKDIMNKQILCYIVSCVLFYTVFLPEKPDKRN